jgi:hypothetical protein
MLGVTVIDDDDSKPFNVMKESTIEAAKDDTCR